MNELWVRHSSVLGVVVRQEWLGQTGSVGSSVVWEVVVRAADELFGKEWLDSLAAPKGRVLVRSELSSCPENWGERAASGSVGVGTGVVRALPTGALRIRLVA